MHMKYMTSKGSDLALCSSSGLDMSKYRTTSNASLLGLVAASLTRRPSDVPQHCFMPKNSLGTLDLRCGLTSHILFIHHCHSFFRMFSHFSSCSCTSGARLHLAYCCSRVL